MANPANERTINIDSVTRAMTNYNTYKGTDKSTTVWLGMKVVGNEVHLEAKKINFWNHVERFFGFGELEWDFRIVDSCLTQCIENKKFDKELLEKFEGNIKSSVNKYKHSQALRIITVIDNVLKPQPVVSQQEVPTVERKNEPIASNPPETAPKQPVIDTPKKSTEPSKIEEVTVPTPTATSTPVKSSHVISFQELGEIEKKYTQDKPYTWDFLQQKGIMFLHGIDPMIPDPYLDDKINNLPHIENFTNLPCLSIDPRSPAPVEDVETNFNMLYKTPIQESTQPIILPVNDHVHFSVFVLSSDRKSLYHFDPLRKMEGRKENNEVLNKIIEEIKKATGAETLTVTYNPTCQQTDGWSCGHWVLNFVRLVAEGKSEREAAESALAPEDFVNTVNDYIAYVTQNENNIPTGLEDYSKSLSTKPIEDLAKEITLCLSSSSQLRRKEAKINQEWQKYTSTIDLNKLQYGELVVDVDSDVDTKEEFAEKLRHLGTFWNERGKGIWEKLDKDQQQFTIKFLKDVTKEDSNDTTTLLTKYCETLPKKMESEFDEELNKEINVAIDPSIDDYEEDCLIESLTNYLSTAIETKKEYDETTRLLNTLPNKLFLCLSVANQHPHGLRDVLLALKQEGAIEPKSPTAIELDQIFVNHSFGKDRMRDFFLDLYRKIYNRPLA